MWKANWIFNKCSVILLTLYISSLGKLSLQKKAVKLQTLSVTDPIPPPSCGQLVVHNFMTAADSAVVLLELDVQWELGRYPLINTNSQQYLLTRQNSFLLIKKIYISIKKLGPDFQLGTPPQSPPSKKKQVALEKSLSLHTCGISAAAAEAV